MPAPFLLDTNAYALLLQNPKSKGTVVLEAAVTVGSMMSFYLPEIVAMEIHSVLGRYRRGGVPSADERCDRMIRDGAGTIVCPHSFLRPVRRRMKLGVFRDLQKLLSDIESQRGPMQATVLPLGQAEIDAGRGLLVKYADQFAFGSHDAVVAGTLLVSMRQGTSLTLVTSDKGLKAMCREEKLPVLDPAI